MHKRMSPVSIFCGVAPLFLVHFAECSSDGQNDQLNGSSQKAYDIAVHGILLWVSMGLLMPLGVLTMRISSSRNDWHKILFYVHAVFQVLSVVLVTIGAVLSIRNFENLFNTTHQRIGLALYGAIYLQFLIGFKRPKRGTRTRRWWYFLHWILGTSICFVGYWNIYTGLKAYHKSTSKSTTLWTIILTIHVSFMTIFYLFQDKWEYIKKQGMIIGIDPNTSLAQLENQKDHVLNEPSRKSNALGT